MPWWQAPPWQPCSDAVNDAYSCADTLDSMVPAYGALVEGGHRLLAYSGDVDGIVPTLATRRWLEELYGNNKTAAAGTGADDAWRAWIGADGNLAGYTERHAGGAAVFATVRNAGHMVPRFQPERAFTMAQRFLHNGTL